MSIKRSSACMLAAAMEHPPALSLCEHPGMAAAYVQPSKRLCSGPSAYTSPHTSHTLTHTASHSSTADAHHYHQQQQVPGSFPLQPLSQLSPGVQAFLARQLSGQPGDPPHTIHTQLPPGFSDAVWQCFGELNLDMEQHFGSLPARAIRGYHSFTRMPRQMLLERFAQTLQQQGHGQALQQWVAGQQQGQGQTLPLQAQLLLLLLDKVLCAYPEAALVEYTLEVQPWMFPWCQRWDLARPPSSPGTPHLVVVTAVHAYAPHCPSAPGLTQGGDAGGPGASGAGLPARVIYVPCFQN